MSKQDGYQQGGKSIPKTILVLLLGLAAFSSALKDLSEFQTLTAEVHNLTINWFGGLLPTVHAMASSPVENRSTNKASQVSDTDEFRWSGRVAQGKTIEIKGINGDITGEPAIGGEVEILARKTGRRSDPESVKVEIVEHPGGVTICALYPTADPGHVARCEPGPGDGLYSSATLGVRNNDVQVDFSVRVPEGVGFTGRTVNGEIKATSLSGNVFSHTVNGSIKISTSGYAEARTVNGEISAKLGNANWPNALEFETLNGGITLELPADLSTQLKAETFNGDIVSDFPVSLLGMISRKHLSGTIGGGGRQLILKTFNGSINLRRGA